MVDRIIPYQAFTWSVSLESGQGLKPLGGFWHAAGLPSADQVTASYNLSPGLSPRKISGVSKVGDVTLKRGVVSGSGDLYNWINSVRTGATASRRSIVIILLNEARQTVTRWKLLSATPRKWVGPNLSAKGGVDVAIEELILAHEGIELA